MTLNYFRNLWWRKFWGCIRRLARKWWWAWPTNWWFSSSGIIWICQTTKKLIRTSKNRAIYSFPVLTIPDRNLSFRFRDSRTLVSRVINCTQKSRIRNSDLINVLLKFVQEVSFWERIVNSPRYSTVHRINHVWEGVGVI